MLAQLSISNFAIVRFLELELSPGMTTITGETGAGKSIAIDALGLCLGDRAEAAVVRPGSAKAEISACFDITHHPKAKQWLQEQELAQPLDASEDNAPNTQSEECILRRTISKEGRSRAFINGVAVPVHQLKQLGQLLVNIHGQHAHQLLIKPQHQLSLLDQYAGHQALQSSCNKQYQAWQSLETEKKQLVKQQSELDAKQQLLQYQVEELDSFGLEPNEFEQIEAEHSRLANGATLQEQCYSALNALCDDENNNAQSLLQHSLRQIESMLEADTTLQSAHGMLHEALIQVDEVRACLHDYEQNLEMDPARFNELEQRLSDAMELARKHHIQPQELAVFHQELAQELAGIQLNASRLEQLDDEITVAKQRYLNAAEKLSKSRKRYAKELNKRITHSMQQLNMPSAQFSILLHGEPESGNAQGIDTIEFQVSTNPGQPLQSLAKVASGGELSRLSLAIEVIIATRVVTPTLIFDEVDVGVSGPTAAVVGKMMRALGESTQVLCVTHLPQVAGTGHQQMRVRKTQTKQQTETQMEPLNQQQRLEELARLLGGDTITPASLANAQELLV